MGAYSNRLLPAREIATLSTTDAHPHRSSKPIVYLVGAGPGDPGLLTVRGAEVLRRAEVVLYDGLSNEAILSHAPRAEHICVGKHGRTRIWRQDEINAEILKHALAGRCVVRLKGGDPAVFARTAEEVDAIRVAGLQFEIVPGITAALAAGSYAGIPITHRGFASAVALVTGHEEPGKPETALDWPALARFPGTLVVYMGVTTANVWTAALIDGGKPADTPAAILRRCSLSDQEIVRCRLDEVAEQLTPASKMRPPVIVIVGAVASLAAHGSWFADRPLFGSRVLITRAEQQIAELALPLRELGAEVLQQPVITIAPVENQSPIREAIARLADYDWLLLTSRNAVRYFFDTINESGLDSRCLAKLRIATVGERTADALLAYGIRPDHVSATSSAAGLVDYFASQPTGLRLLWPCAARATETLITGLSQSHRIDPVVTYQHHDHTRVDPDMAEQMRAGLITWTTVTSSAIAESLIKMFGQDLQQTKLVSLSSKISNKLVALGFPVAAEAQQPSMASLIEAISPPQ